MTRRFTLTVLLVAMVLLVGVAANGGIHPGSPQCVHGNTRAIRCN